MMMALGLVITTVIGVGLFIHWIWPDLPIGRAFAIAAILCHQWQKQCKQLLKERSCQKEQ